jgi:hypothetical protein
MRRLFRYEIRRSRMSADGDHVISIGVRLGYYPCLKAPFIQFTLWSWCIDFWYGLPSVRQASDK